MAVDNVAVHIEDFDAGLTGAVYNATTEDLDLEFEHGESVDLLPGARSVPSFRSGSSQAKTLCSHVWSGFKSFMNYTKFIWIVAAYSVFGAVIFMWLEIPADLEAKEQQRQYHLIARDVLLFNIRQIHNERPNDIEFKWKKAIMEFEERLEVSLPENNSDWTFWMAVLYAGTIYTTIGYGNISCRTNAGRMVTMLYSLVGIPLMLIILDQLGDFLLRLVKRGNCIAEDLVLFIGVKTRLIRIKSEKSLARYIKMSKKMAFIGLSSGSVPSKVSASVQGSEKGRLTEDDHNQNQTVVDMSPAESDSGGSSGSKDKKDDWEPDPPVLASIILTIGWIMASAAAFCFWEDWTYFTSVYFFFISTSTIGFGDVTPDHPEYMIAAFGVVIVGLSLVSVCINVVQERIQKWYMSILEKMLKEYIEAEKRGDVNAAKGFMSGVNSQAKYLFPLISKQQNAKAMESLKKSAKDQGIELPPALTEIDPDTGKPAYLNASEAELDQIVEKAMSEGKATPIFLKPPESAISIQASFFGDREMAQTQTDISFDFFEAHRLAVAQADAVTGASVAVDVRPPVRTTGVQPEVSCILRSEPVDSEFEHEYFSGSEDAASRVRLTEAEVVQRAFDEGIPLVGEELGESQPIFECPRFLKSTGTQMEICFADSGFQTDATTSSSIQVQTSISTESASLQTDEKEVRAIKTQTKLTTFARTPEELELEKEKAKEERRKELITAHGTALPRPRSRKKKIVLDSAERTALKAKLMALRLDQSTKQRQQGKPIAFDVSEEKRILLDELKKIRKSKPRRRSDHPSSSSEDDVFLSSSSAPSSPPPGSSVPLQLKTTAAPPGHLVFNVQQAPSTSSGQQTELHGRIEVVDGVVTYFDPSGRPVFRQAAQVIEQLDLDELQKQLMEAGVPTQSGLQLVSPQGVVIDLNALTSGNLRRQPSQESSSSDLSDFGLASGLMLSGVIAAAAALGSAAETGEGEAEQEQERLIKNLVRRGSKKASSIGEGLAQGIEIAKAVLVQTATLEGEEQPPLSPSSLQPFESRPEVAALPTAELDILQFPAGWTEEAVEITLNVELIKRSIDTFTSRSSAGQAFESVTSDELPIEELESLIDYDDLFDQLDALDEEEDEIEMFMGSATVQTDLSFFERVSIGSVASVPQSHVGTDPVIRRESAFAQTDLSSVYDELAPRTAEAPPAEVADASVQTAPSLGHKDAQAVVEMEEKCCGGRVEYESSEVQTTEKDTRDVFSEARVSSSASAIQTEAREVGDQGTQVKAETKSQGTVHEAMGLDVAVQYEGSVAARGVQTERAQLTDLEVQSGPVMAEAAAGTEVTHAEVHVEVKAEVRDMESQTETPVFANTAAGSEEVCIQTAVQSSSSQFYKPEGCVEDEEIRYLVDNSTEQDYELVMHHASTQHSILCDDFGQQHQPSVAHASLQCGAVFSERSVQTNAEVPVETPAVEYSCTAMQTSESLLPIMVEAQVSVASSLSSLAATDVDEDSFPSFVVDSITLTQDIETQVEVQLTHTATAMLPGEFGVHAETQAELEQMDAGTTMTPGEFSTHAETQAQSVMLDRQTSLDEDDLEQPVSQEPVSVGCLWGDFDTYVEGDEEEEYQEEPEMATAHADVRPAGAQQTTQTGATSLAMEDEFVQAAVETSDKSIGGDAADLAASEAQTGSGLLEIALSDLNAQRRERMVEIGIQTGVLARVQNIFDQRSGMGAQTPGSPIVRKVTLRKQDLPEGISSTLSPASSAAPTEVGESSGTTSPAPSERPGPSWAFDSPGTRPSRPGTEQHRTTTIKPWERQQTVGDLRTRFEQAASSQVSSASGSMQNLSSQTDSERSRRESRPSPRPKDKTKKEKDREKREKEKEKEEGSGGKRFDHFGGTRFEKKDT